MCGLSGDFARWKTSDVTVTTGEKTKSYFNAPENDGQEKINSQRATTTLWTSSIFCVKPSFQEDHLFAECMPNTAKS